MFGVVEFSVDYITTLVSQVVKVCESIFSRVMFVFTDYRKRLAPVHLEAQMFLFTNRRSRGPVLFKFVEAF